MRPLAKESRKNLPPPTPSEAAFDTLLATFGAPANDQLGDSVSPPFPSTGSGQAKLRVTERADVILSPSKDGPQDASSFIDDLFARKNDFLERDRYLTIGDASEFHTKVAGISFEGRQDIAGGMQPGAALMLERDPHNPHDPNAIKVMHGALHLGYLNRGIARRLAEPIDNGTRYRAEVASITGGGTKHFGINIRVWRERAIVQQARTMGHGGASRGDVQHALLGEKPLRDAQRAVLDRVEAGHNTLAVLGTGRGKSLCFQLPAAVRAIERDEKTVVLYPLRALANDQFYALERRLGPLGLRIFRANGSIESSERASLMDALETGDWDIICSTPEFFQFHHERFATAASRPAFVVVDESHHLFESTHRPAYSRVGATLRALGNPQVLALTATASDEVFAHITASLNIDRWVIDPTVRDNLHVIDARGATNKGAYIEERLREPGKAIIYCNSRTEATKIAEKLRATIGNEVAFYHAGMPSADRAQVESMFRDGAIRVVASTSAFGEGIDLPDIRNVFLFHLNFNFTEFNQQSGRAGRDGDDAEIHLLFNEKDRNINEFILEKSAPTLHTLRALYRELRKIAIDDTIRSMTFVDIAETLALEKVAPETVSAAFRIFADAGLAMLGEDDDGKFFRFLPVEGKIDLTQNERFAEGEAEREDFSRFAELVLKAKGEVLENVINRPIYPSGVPLVR